MEQEQHMKKLINEFEKLGYTYQEAKELAKELDRPRPITVLEVFDINDASNSLIDEFNSIGCTSFQFTAEELEKLIKE